VYEIEKTQRLNFYFLFFERTQRFQKTLKKIIEICCSFDNLGTIRTFWNITIVEMFILKKNSVWNWPLINLQFGIFVWHTTIAHPTWISFDEIIITWIKKGNLKKCLKKNNKIHKIQKHWKVQDWQQETNPNWNLIYDKL